MNNKLLPGQKINKQKSISPQKKSRKDISSKKQNQKNPSQIKLLETLHNSIEFLQLFDVQQLKEILEFAHIFSFVKGTTVAKQNQPIDYLGIILGGKAIGGNKMYEAGSLIGYEALHSLQDNHLYSIIAENEGIILAVRLENIIKQLNRSIKIKIISYTAKENLKTLKNQRQSRMQLSKNWQEVEQKKVSKYFWKQLKQFLQTDIDTTERNKLLNYFPFYTCKSKQLIISKNTPAYILIVLQGELIIKNGEKTSNILLNGHIYNVQGFIFHHTTYSNVYCLTNQATFWLIDKQLIQSIMKPSTLHALYHLILDYECKNKSYNLKKDEKIQNYNQIWSIFNKISYEIVPLPKSNIFFQNKKITKDKNTTEKSLQIYQTLFKQHMRSMTSKTKNSMVNSQTNKRRLLFKTQQRQTNKSSEEELIVKLQGQLELISNKLNVKNEQTRRIKLQLIEKQAKLNMHQVMKQISKMGKYSNLKVASQNVNGNKSSLNSYSTKHHTTLKEVFEDHIKNNRIQVLVAKCAYKWLQLTRKHREISKNSNADH